MQKIITWKCDDSFFCKSVGHPHDDTVIIVTFTVTGFLLSIAIIAIVIKRRDLRARWQRLRRQQNDEQRPILGGNGDGVVEETRNNLQASTSGESEEVPGRDSGRPSPSGASMLNKDNINSNLKNASKTVP